MTTLSIIVPAYNESHRIIPTLQILEQYCATATFNCEVIVVDDGSSDGTAALVDQQQLAHVRTIRQPKNLGKFAALRAGIEAAKHDWILLYDADGATPINMLEQFLPLTEQYDVLIGSRRVADANIVVKQSLLRTVLGRVAYLTIRLVAGITLKDTQCGFKLCRRSLALPAIQQMTVQRFAGDVEWIYLMQWLGGKVKEVPVAWHDVPHSTVKLKDYVQSLRDLIKIHHNITHHIYKKYNQ